MSILSTIVAHKREEVEARKALLPLSSLASSLPSRSMRDFRAALTDIRKAAPRVIAEVKRRSPSKGDLRPDLDPAEVAAIYEQNGAAAISVLTDDRFFGGSLADLVAARQAVSLPVLCKEFIVDPYQIYEAREAGADAVLLIAGVLDTNRLRDYRMLAAELGMASLVEVHSELELDSALLSGMEIVGINNRDLNTFTVSLHTTRRILPLVPEGVVTVSESGIHTASDRDFISSLGVDALLVGEGLLVSPDLALATREICGVSSDMAKVI
ncbi:MAG: indole-3-glycerol phosphate synthase TrpC [Chloroflexota bacterium]|nr:indole-3-glycerol phosphate synthase TrpC [Chloroflexota bacterium]